jgi:hypothetical protein
VERRMYARGAESGVCDSGNCTAAKQKSRERRLPTLTNRFSLGPDERFFSSLGLRHRRSQHSALISLASCTVRRVYVVGVWLR